MRDAFIDSLVEQAEKDGRIFLVTPDVGFSVLERFADRFPDRFLNVGIAEQNAVGVAAGLALSGRLPYVYSMVPFVTMRCFEQVRLDVAYMNVPVRLVGVGGGLVYGPAGATHHSIEDIALMRALPNMTVCCPGDPLEVGQLIGRSFEHGGPLYFRLGKNGEPAVHRPGTTIHIGRAVTVAEGDDLALITTGGVLEQGVQWRGALAGRGIDVTLLSMPTIKPLDSGAVIGLIERGIPIATLEEHSVIGGLGSAVSEVIAEHGRAVRFRRFGIPDVYTHAVGSQKFLKDAIGLGSGAVDLLAGMLS